MKLFGMKESNFLPNGLQKAKRKLKWLIASEIETGLSIADCNVIYYFSREPSYSSEKFMTKIPEKETPDWPS